MISFLILEGIFMFSDATDKTWINMYLVVFKFGALLTELIPMYSVFYSSRISSGAHKTIE